MLKVESTPAVKHDHDTSPAQKAKTQQSNLQSDVSTIGSSGSSPFLPALIFNKVAGFIKPYLRLYAELFDTYVIRFFLPKEPPKEDPLQFLVSKPDLKARLIQAYNKDEFLNGKEELSAPRVAERFQKEFPENMLEALDLAHAILDKLKAGKEL